MSAKNTKYSLAVEDVLKNSKTPITAKNIIDDLLKNNISVWPSTIYRILDKLVQNGSVEKVTKINENIVYYQFSQNEHLHVAYCLKCEKRQEIHVCPMPILEDEVFESTGFEVTDHKMELYGYCKECKGKY